MFRTYNPPGVFPPASNYRHVASVPDRMRWCVLSGQVGTHPDGSIAKGFDAQMECCLENIRAALQSDGMGIEHIVKITVFVTPNGPDVVASYRDIRDRFMGDHAPAATYLGVTSLAHPDFLVEIDAIAAAPV